MPHSSRQRARHGVGRRLGGHRRVEGRVEDGDVRDARERPARLLDRRERGRVVQRRERARAPGSLVDVVVDHAPARGSARRRGRRGGRPRRRRRLDRRATRPASTLRRSSTSESFRLVEPALTTRTAPRVRTARSSRGSRGGPRRARASTRARAAGGRPSPGAACAACAAEPRDAVDHVHDEVEAVEVVEHDHVERRRGRALLLVAAHVEVVVVRRAGR